jgi:hypothetical protein
MPAELDHRNCCPDCLWRWGIDADDLTALDLRNQASRHPILADTYNKLDILADGQNDHDDRLMRLELDIKALRAALRYTNERRIAALERANGGPPQT